METVLLLEQGSFTKATYNILISVFACLLAVWLGLLAGCWCFMRGAQSVGWGWLFPTQ